MLVFLGLSFRSPPFLRVAMELRGIGNRGHLCRSGIPAGNSNYNQNANRYSLDGQVLIHQDVRMRYSKSRADLLAQRGKERVKNKR
jgi:hypothetical protein